MIDSPSNDIYDGESITFGGVASDAEERNLTRSTSSLSCRSFLDGVLGNGKTVVTSSLNVDTRLITVSVDDSGGLAGSHTISASAVSSPDSADNDEKTTKHGNYPT
jgi:hypothetical protein